ncbi:MAG: 23S rRNA (pseudouridine(1915)-N(3))-methyltransferase RlmH [Deltaproteobacteria bacterium]|nr:23S rRNA (pseudouridine(1915)-N(3))-methyltransferase RlmH [Deltaproteobacteria bacterium]
MSAADPGGTAAWEGGEPSYATGKGDVRITLIAVGRTKNAHATALCADYAKRIKRMNSFTVNEVKDARGQDPKRAMKVEGERLLAQIPVTAVPVLLDEHGTRRTSVELSKWMSGLQRDTRELCFVLGGPWGFDDPVRARCRHSLRLSDMTLPHELARVLLLEQLYRALSIQQGGKYHHGTPGR